jgi:glycine dehydrogenase
MKLNADYQERFEQRHIAPNAAATAEMLKTLGVSSLEELIDQTIPAKINNRFSYRRRKVSLII